MHLLTARTKTGKTICLGYNYNKETLLFLRTNEEFICPVCGEHVLLKLGDQRIHHFAHKKGGSCRDYYERETVYHMEGKRQLYQWLVRQRIPSALEYYDSEIQQRPDIMFKYNGKKYALEYQCSPISEDIFRKRTETYDQNGYIPLWIIGSKHIKEKAKNNISLSSFDYYFLRKATDDQYYIPAYCPENRLFLVIGSILPYSIQNAIVQKNAYSLAKVKIDHILGPNLTNQINVNHWKEELEKFTYHWSLHPNPNPQQRRFFHEIYKNNLNLVLLPPEIGLPVRHSILIQTPPIIWQTYIYLDLISQKVIGQEINLNEAENSLRNRIRRKELTVRQLPQIKKANPLMAVKEYFLQLERQGILIQRSETIYRLQRKLIIPKSNRESAEQRQNFLYKYK